MNGMQRSRIVLSVIRPRSGINLTAIKEMSQAPLLSICIPAYNRPLLFRRSLESITIENEKYSASIEIIVTDDSDGRECEEITREVLLHWTGSHIYEHHAKRLGMVENWNRSICLAKGHYVLILHDDDFLLQNAIAKIIGCIKAINYPVFLFGVEVVDEQERVMKRQVFKQNQFLLPRAALIRLLSNSSFVRFPAIVIKRFVFDRVGLFSSEWQEPCDLEMWIRLFSNYGVYCLKDITVAYRVHSQALTTTMFNQQTIDLLLKLFAEVLHLSILSKEEIENCQALFLHQFILAGAWRQLRRRRLQEFKQVMGLLEISGVRELVCPSQWWLLRVSFDLLGSFLRGTDRI